MAIESIVNPSGAASELFAQRKLSEQPRYPLLANDGRSAAQHLSQQPGTIDRRPSKITDLLRARSNDPTDSSISRRVTGRNDRGKGEQSPHGRNDGGGAGGFGHIDVLV